MLGKKFPGLSARGATLFRLDDWSFKASENGEMGSSVFLSMVDSLMTNLLEAASLSGDLPETSSIRLLSLDTAFDIGVSLISI